MAIKIVVREAGAVLVKIPLAVQLAAQSKQTIRAAYEEFATSIDKKLFLINKGTGKVYQVLAVQLETDRRYFEATLHSNENSFNFKSRYTEQTEQQYIVKWGV